MQHIYQNQSPETSNGITFGGGGNQQQSTTTTLPFTANGGGNFIISASSLSALPPELFLNGSMINKPTLIGNGSYVIPVSMKLMNAANPSNQSQTITMTANGPVINGRNNNSGNSSSNGPTLMFQQQQTTQQPQSPHLVSGSVLNSSSPPGSPRTPMSPTNLGNIVIKTSSGGGGGGRTRVEDEVDLLKDLLVRNLNSAKEQNFYGICTRCNDKIIGAENGLRAMDNLFHVTCFVCYGCGSQLQGHHFYAMENRSFCENCYMV